MAEPPARLTPARRRLLDRLFDELLDLGDSARRSRLDRLAHSHPRLHAHLARLAAAADPDDDEFMTAFGRVGAAALASLDACDEPMAGGTRVGDWRLLETVGRGGMGQVYRAERADGAFEMQAAIKFIRTSTNRRLAERLAVERQLLARLDHPGIARLIDGGTLDDGQGYLVMEWIEGRDLTDCRDELLADPMETLRRFADLSSAVAHAHQRRVVHGDIKPANVRMTADGRMRLLDFGVARLVTDDVEHGGLAALTPAFSAPEQLAGEPASTQSDLYALGALLRWLLTGRPGRADAPPARSELPAPRPGALQAILDRAMRADPAERYRSVPEFTDDLLALLENRPVRARRTGALARFWLWSRRHRLAAALLGLTAASVVIASLGLAWQSEQVREQRDAALYEAERLALLREQMVLLFREAGRQAEDRPDDGPGPIGNGMRGATGDNPRGLLADSAALAQRLYAGDAETRAAMQAFLGEIYIALDDFEAAEPLLEAVLADGGAETDRVTAFVEADLAQIRLRQGRSEEALALADQALDRLRAHSSSSSVAYVADTLQIRGQALRGLGRWDAAIDALREAHRLARTLPGPSRLRATTANNLGTTLIYLGRNADALPYLERSLANWRGLDRADSPGALTVMGNLAGLRHQRGDLADAEALYRETLRRRIERYGDSGALAAMHLNLGSLLVLTGRIDEGERHIAEGLAMIERFEGRDSVSYTRGLQARARLDREAGRFARAREEIGRVVERFADQVGPDHLFTSIARMDQALTDAVAGEAGGLEALDRALQALERGGASTARFRAEARCHEAALRIERGLDGAGEAAAECERIYVEEVEVSEWRGAEARLLRAVAENRPATQALLRDLDTVARTLGPTHGRTERLRIGLLGSAARRP
ncbi:serine/threonine-protein kinase [Halomonas denitrificans]|nr:serine/threonine-protein kinase [Halomonas denitrificans]